MKKRVIKEIKTTKTEREIDDPDPVEVDHDQDQQGLIQKFQEIMTKKKKDSILLRKIKSRMKLRKKLIKDHLTKGKIWIFLIHHKLSDVAVVCFYVLIIVYNFDYLVLSTTYFMNKLYCNCFEIENSCGKRKNVELLSV